MFFSLPLAREYSQQHQVPAWGGSANPIDKVISPPLYHQTCGGDGSFVHQNLLNKGFGCSLFVHAFGFDTREEAIQVDRIVARDGLGMLKRIGRLRGGFFGGGWEPSIQICASQILERGHALGFHHLFVVGEDGGVVVLIPELVLTKSLLSDGDDDREEMKAGRVSLKAYLGVGLEWAWAGLARASSDWALIDEFGLEPLM